MIAVVQNSYSAVYGAGEATAKAINTLTSYRVEGYQFTGGFRAGTWDGYVRLLRRTRDGGLKFPTGLLSDVLRVLENRGIAAPEIDDRRRPLGKRHELSWLADDIEPRDYQREALDVATASRGVMSGRGILKLPIRSGKTVIAAMLIREWGRRATFVATSQLILEQTHRLFTRIFGEGVGLIGDGSMDPRFLTVASIQRLQRMDAPVKKLLRDTDVLLVDEVHHMKGDSWRVPILEADARYKIGLSATVTTNRRACAASAVYLKSATGPIVMDVPMARLVDAGYIMSPDILVVDLDGVGPDATGATYQDAYDRLIVMNKPRNRIIVEAAQLLVAAGHRVLIDTGRLEHIRRLYKRATSIGVEAAMIYGGVGSAKRATVLQDFREGRKPVLIGTVMGEGVDVPVLSAVINAEGGKSESATIQRMRNLTMHPDKTRAVLVDFADTGSRYLKSHARARLKQYRSEPAFTVVGPLTVSDFLHSLRDEAA